VIRYVAFLRGVSPMNASMPRLKKAFEAAGFTEVRTLLSSGNVVFSGHQRSEAAIVRLVEAAIEKDTGHRFFTIVRRARDLRELIESDPFSAFRLPEKAKRVVTFLRKPHKKELSLPIAADGARILAIRGREAFSAYLPNPRGPVFMTLIERTLGAEVTTRTWDTVTKCASAAVSLSA
jgi:uncharacterized protein (DUF1697 family)